MSDPGTPEAEPPAPVDDDDGMPEVVGLREAARLVGMPLSTFRRRLPELEREGARRKDDGQGWLIPVEALHALRLFDRVSSRHGGRWTDGAPPAWAQASTDTGQGSTAAEQPGTGGTLPPGALGPEDAARLQAELGEARKSEAEARERAAAWEARAEERERALRMLAEQNALALDKALEGPRETIRLLEERVPPPAAAPEPRRRWFGGKRPAGE